MKNLRRLIVAATTMAALGAAVPALAAWTSNGNAPASSSATTFATAGAPSLDGAAGTTSLPISWTAATSPSGVASAVTYLVQRAAYSATPVLESAWSTACDSVTTPVAGTSCTDTGLTAATDYMYRVTARFQLWRSVGPQGAKISTASAVVIPTPTVTSCNPTSIARNGTRTVTVTGTNFTTDAVATVPTGNGITAVSSSYVSSTTITMQVTMNNGAQTTGRNVTVTNGTGGPSATRNNCFSITT